MVVIDYNTNKRLGLIQNAVDEDILRFEYNEAGELTRVIPVNNFTLADFKAIYDKFGRQRKIIWGNFTAEYGYGSSSQVIQSVTSSGNINITRL